MKTPGVCFFFLFLLAMNVVGQTTKDDTLRKQENNLKSDTATIEIKSISTQLINLRDSIGVELMAMDKRLIHASEANKINLEKAKSSLSVYRAELDKLVEELTVADVSYITDAKKRSFRAVADIRREFHKIVAQSKAQIKG